MVNWSFLECVCKSCVSNLSPIAYNGMPSGSGRKGRRCAKEKTDQSSTVSVTISIRKCLQSQSSASTKPTIPRSSPITSQATTSALLSRNSLTLVSQMLALSSMLQCLIVPQLANGAASAYSLSTTPTTSTAAFGSSLGHYIL